MGADGKTAFNPIWRTIAIDQRKLAELAPVLAEHGLMPLLERISGLFEELPGATQTVFDAKGINPYVRRTSEGVQRAWDFVLRVFMGQSAHAQYLHSVAHLLRGHSFEIFGHVRTMIENAGIAALSVREPDVADIYLDIERQDEFKRRTGASRILPTSDPLTADLNSDFATASRTFHSNFVAVAGRVQSQFETSQEGRISFTSEMRFHDTSATDPSWLLRHAGWLARVSARCLRLLGMSLDLAGSGWFGKLDRLDHDLQEVLEPLGRALFSAAPADPDTA
jgi:hypothetical protein